MHLALQHWTAEHDAMAAVLQGLSFVARRLLRAPAATDFTALRAMLVYLGDYPEQIHHAREESELFVLLNGRDPAIDAIILRLQADHRAGGPKVRELERQLLRAEFGSAADLDRFTGSAERFVVSYHAHMQIEETQVLPRVERLLTGAELDAIAARLAEQRDPLFGTPRDAPYDALFERIVELAPAVGRATRA